jgi:MFS superfamily sulfate permease-like transporter
MGNQFLLAQSHAQSAMTLTHHENQYLLRLHKDVSFLNKAVLRKDLASIPDGAELTIDGKKIQYVDHDILETMGDFIKESPGRKITVEVEGITIPVRQSSGH